MTSGRSFALRALLGLGAAGCASRAASTPPKGRVAIPASPEARPSTAPKGRAPVVVAIVVDQFSAWVAEERLPRLPGGGGLGRLVRDGTWVKHLRLPYASTDTAPGHAALHTGKVPAESGIWGNELPDPTTGGRVTFLRENGVKLVAPDGLRDAPSSSAARLRADTAADRLRAAHPEALVVTVSLKDRGAIMAGGKKPSFALWFDVGAGSFVTSTAFASTFPGWAKAIGGPGAVVRAREAPWSPSDRGWLERNVGFADDAPGEGDLDGLGTTFPHLAKTSRAFRLTPASDAVLLELALAAVEAEYDPKKPTLLLLSMSASDVLGHVYGPDSWEAWDHLYKLDAALGAFFRRLEERVGEVSVVLSADHGNSSMPEVVRTRRPSTCDGPSPPPADAYGRSPCTKATRINPSALQEELGIEIGKAMGPGSWFLGLADPYVFLTPEARALEPTKRARIDAAVRRVFERNADTLVEAFDVRALERQCPPVLAKARGIPERALPGEDTLTLVCRSWSPSLGAGDFYIVPRLGTYFDSEIVVGKGAGHGGPFLHDRTVPMLVRARGIAAGRVIEAPVDFTAYSALLGAFLGLDPADPNAILRERTASPPR